MPILKRTPTEDGQADYIDAWEAIDAYRAAIAHRASARCETERDVFQQQADAIRRESAPEWGYFWLFLTNHSTRIPSDKIRHLAAFCHFRGGSYEFAALTD